MLTIFMKLQLHKDQLYVFFYLKKKEQIMIQLLASMDSNTTVFIQCRLTKAFFQEKTILTQKK